VFNSFWLFITSNSLREVSTFDIFPVGSKKTDGLPILLAMKPVVEKGFETVKNDFWIIRIGATLSSITQSMLRYLVNIVSTPWKCSWLRVFIDFDRLFL
jgi:hypothetical protein